MKKYLSLLLITYLLTSCIPTRKLKYVQESDSDNFKNEYYNDRSEKTIQPYDYLYIKIYSLDEKTNSIFNGNNNYNSNTELLSYAVDDKGNLSIPFIGQINVKDLTINQAKEKIEKSLSVYLSNISVMVRFVSNKVTVLGDVRQPGEYPFFDEKVTVFQALGFAGGSGDFGNLTQVTLVREKDNNLKYYNLDLTKRNIASSENYYLIPGDVLIVNPINAKYTQMKLTSYQYLISVLGTTVSLITSSIYISKL
jgi:polysaccharide biosynthesis/export protein